MDLSSKPPHSVRQSAQQQPCECDLNDRDNMSIQTTQLQTRVEAQKRALNETEELN